MVICIKHLLAIEEETKMNVKSLEKYKADIKYIVYGESNEEHEC